jgi:hypothetical protein
MLPNKAGFSCVTVSQAILKGGDLLIGMDVIGAGDFAVSNFNGKTTLTFRSPSVGTLDFVKNKDRGSAPLKARPKVGRNAPCPCGSGKKAKNCCQNR